MTRNIWKPALALGAVLAVTGIARAGDRDTMLLSGGPADKVGAATMTLGGTGSAAQAATEDNELTHGYRYRGYYGWGGGYGYRGYYGGYGGWNRGWGGYGWNRGYYGGFYPRSYVSFNIGRPYYGGWGGGWGGYRPAFSYSSFSYRSYPVYSGFYDCGPSIYLGIGGGSGTAAPAVNLGASGFAPPVLQQPEFAQPMAQPAEPEGTFPYDGGPSNPVPLPKGDAQPQPIPPAIPDATDLPISGKAKPGLAPAKTPYKYKAYGEK
jgi:hypothetical protein